MNRIRFMLLFCCATLFCAKGIAQQWQALDNVSFSGVGRPYAIYGDSVFDRLFLGGTMKQMRTEEDTLSVNGLAAWNGQSWDTLGSSQACDDGNTVCQQVYWFTRYRNELYVCGGFPFLEPGDTAFQSSFARIVGQDAHLEGVTCYEPSWNPIVSFTQALTNDTMYFAGYRGSFCGLEPSNVFSYDGTNFQRFAPFDTWPAEQGIYVGLVFKFLDHFYMTGLLGDSTSTDFYGLLRYTGEVWEPVPGFETPAPIKDILIHNDTLYMAGYFFEGPGSPGNMVTMYDGEQWSDLGGGMLYEFGSDLGIVLDLEWWHGKLLACGQFHRAGGAQIEHIAQWNGHQWCGTGSDFENDNPIFRMTTWRDTLYISGGFDSVNGVPIHSVAKWEGGDFDAVCSEPVGVPTNHADQLLNVRTIDAEGLWEINPPGNGMLRMYDAQGRVLFTIDTSTRQRVAIDLRSFAAGIYLAHLTAANGATWSARLLRP